MMSTACRISEQNELHYVTVLIVRRVDIFKRQIYRDIVIESLRFFQQHKALDIYASVIMSNHIHLLLRSPLANSSTFINRTLIKNAHLAIKRQVNWIFASRRPAISSTKAEPLPNLSRLFLICYAEQGELRIFTRMQACGLWERTMTNK